MIKGECKNGLYKGIYCRRSYLCCGTGINGKIKVSRTFLLFCHFRLKNKRCNISKYKCSGCSYSSKNRLYKGIYCRRSYLCCGTGINGKNKVNAGPDHGDFSMYRCNISKYKCSGCSYSSHFETTSE